MTHNYLIGFLLLLVLTNCSSEEVLDIESILTSKEWVADQYKLSTENTFEAYSFKNVYNFQEDGSCLIKRPFSHRFPIEIDTVFKEINWNLEVNNSVIKLIGNDTIISSIDTLIYELNDWKIIEFNHSSFKVEHIDSDGIPNGYLEILIAK